MRKRLEGLGVRKLTEYDLIRRFRNEKIVCDDGSVLTNEEKQQLTFRPIWMFMPIIIGDVTSCFRDYLKINISEKQNVYQNKKSADVKITHHNRNYLFFYHKTLFTFN